MRLSLQLTLLLVALVLLLFAGTFWINLDSARGYLSRQLASHAQDAATSLGISLSSRQAFDDAALARSMADAMFDRGDYLELQVERLDGALLADRRVARVAPEVPHWFTDRVVLETPLGESTVMQGWRQVGVVRVRSHPGYAYEQLWGTVQRELYWYLGGFLLTLGIGLLGLRVILTPLRRVREQAEAICNREFPVVERAPFTLDFRRLVEAMNRMSVKVRQMLDGAEQLAERLREQAYRDSVTGLANRRQLRGRLAHVIDHPDGLAGGLVLVQLRDFKQYNLAHGYLAGDRLLQACAKLLQENVLAGVTATPARLAGADFAVLLEDADPERFALQAERFADALAMLTHDADLPSADLGHVGAVYHRGHAAEELFADADQALRRAQLEGANQCVVMLEASGGAEARTATRWREMLTDAIGSRRLRLVRQPVFDLRGHVIHEEVLVRLEDPDAPGELLPASRFLPQADALGLAGALDRAVLAQVLPHLDEGGLAVSVNLSRRSLEDSALLTWVEEQVRRHRVGAGRLLLEVTEYGAGAHIEALRRWVARLSPFGVEFCLDHYGRGFSSFRYLRGLKAHWLKVDGSFVRGLDREPDHQFYLQILCEIAHGLDMRVIAESVETEAVWRLLPGLGLDGGQGYWLGRPE
jgi:diguanylate cyclase (GGDEF)-like protein